MKRKHSYRQAELIERNRFILMALQEPEKFQEFKIDNLPPNENPAPHQIHFFNRICVAGSIAEKMRSGEITERGYSFSQFAPFIKQIKEALKPKTAQVSLF